MMHKQNFGLRDTAPMLLLYLESVATGNGKTGIAYNTSGLAATIEGLYYSGTITLQSTSTPGTYEQPSSMFSARLAERGHGIYELHLHPSLVEFQQQYMLTLYGAADLRQSLTVLNVGEPVGNIDGNVPPAGVGPIPCDSSTVDSVTIGFIAGLVNDQRLKNRIIVDSTGLSIAACTSFDGPTGTFTVVDVASSDGDWIAPPDAGNLFYLTNNYYAWGTFNRTLTSFGTLVADTATAVWSSATRTLTSFGTLVADVAAAVWASATRTLTSFGSLVSDLIAAGGSVTVTSPLTQNGRRLEIVQGDDYRSADGRAISWSSTGWPDVTGATVNFVGLSTDGSDSFTWPMTVVDSDTVRLELTAAQTSVRSASSPYSYAVQATIAGNKVTLARGQMKVSAPMG